MAKSGIRVITRGGTAREIEREFTRGAKVEMQEVVRYWWKVFLPRHFKPGAATKYGYQERTGAYRKRKRKVVGHATPLVFSGRLQRMVRQSIAVSGSAKRVRGRMQGPRYLWFRVKPGSKHPDKKTEITKLLDTEAEELSRRVSQRIQKRIDGLKGTKTEVF